MLRKVGFNISDTGLTTHPLNLDLLRPELRVRELGQDLIQVYLKTLSSPNISGKTSTVL